ncbi:MAG: hypothetical protein KDE55_20025, partial [Novosphingobium sp.]|nr:hypothetical protein [Novosphingobium sp.]
AMFLAMASLPAAAHAQAAPALAAGATVYGPQGGEVGKIEKVDGDVVVVNTGTHTATLQKSAFGSNDKGIAIGFTQAQLNQAIEAADQAAQAKLTAALVAGAAVRTMDGVPLGVIKSVAEDGTIVVQREAGPFSLKKDQFSTDNEGVIIRLTKQQIDDALAQLATASTDSVE